MNRNSRYRHVKETGTGRSRAALWKRMALTLTMVALVIGLLGCSLDDLLTPFSGDIPFEQEPTKSSDMGAVDNTPTVPNVDRPLDDTDFHPL